MAEALDVPAEFIATGTLGRRLTAPWRHAVQAARTIRLLRARRPDVLYVMAPPVPLVVLGLLYQRVARRPLVIDAHTGAVVHDDGRPRVLFLRLARRATATIVTTEALQRIVERAGGSAIALHDPPLGDPAGDEDWPPPMPTVVMPASWWRDEPLEQLRDAARLVPEIRIVLTGTPRGPLAEPSSWPGNVRLAGWLDDRAYRELVGSATALVALTTRDLTMQRAGYEAVILGRPAVVSDTEVLRDYFTSGAVIAGPTAPELADALRDATTRAVELARQMRELRREKQAEFATGVDEVRRRLASSVG